MPKTLTLRRRGQFTLETDGDYHCGLDENQKIKYMVTVVCKAEPSLDERDFLFEQRLIDEFFQDLSHIGPLDASCERLSMNCAEGLLAKIKHENPDCKVLSIEVELSAKPYMASMTFWWHSKKPLRKKKSRD